MNRYKLVHSTNFSYDGPVSESYNELRLRPRHDENQSCLSFRVSTNPAAKAIAHQDFYGNWVHVFHILCDHRLLRVDTEAVVLMHPQPPPPPSELTLRQLDGLRDTLLEDHYDFLSPSQYCPFLPAVRELVTEAELRSDGSAYRFTLAASNLIHDTFRYEKGATHVHSSVADCLETKTGVCQDFSHLLIAVLRLRCMPARYVSGYLVPPQEADQGSAMERVIGGFASHAWVQAFIPDMGWFGLDPTSGSLDEARHVRIAHGRDYADVTPVRGVYKGHAGQSLSVDVSVLPAIDDEGAEILQETAAVPPAEPDEEGRPSQQQQQQ